MNRLFKAMLVVAALLAIAYPTQAQTRKNHPRPTREQLAQKQAQLIARELCLNDEASEKFMTAYMNCQREVWALEPRHGNHKRQSLTEHQTDSLIRARFDHSQKLLDIRKKYYNEYRKFLTAKQIERVYQRERQTMDRLSKRGDKGNRRGRK